ncbi:MAG: glycosyltransferase family 4 protein [Nanoarchaeota archaeon]
MSNKKNIKVHLQYPWLFPDSSYYKNLITYPPKDVIYTNYSQPKLKKMKGIESQMKFKLIMGIKNFLKSILSIIGIPNILPVTEGNYDILHCAHCLPITKKPWIVDTETFNLLGDRGKFCRPIIKKFLLSKNCKKIVAWSEASKQSIIEAFPNEKKIIDKIDILHFALPAPKFKKIKHKNLRILFIARWFDSKGGLQTLEIFDRLTRKYNNLECLFVCYIPKSMKKKYKIKEKYQKNSRIKFIDIMSQERLFREIYPSCDIFFYPGFGDSYGFAVPEAMSFGLPIVSSRTFAKDELISDGKTGFLIDMPNDWKPYFDMNEKMLNDFFEKTCKLIEDSELRKKMGLVGRKEIESGKFSIQKRNKKLRKIYEDSILS